MTLSRDQERLLTAYRSTRYEARLPDGRSIGLRDGEASEPLSEFMVRQHPGIEHWVFITAWNPRSVRRSERENEEAMLQLRAELRDRGYAFVEGVGRGTDGWEEPSLLVFGPTPAEALSLGARYGQNAVVIGHRMGPATVVWCEA